MAKTKREVERAPEERNYTLFCFTPNFLQCCNNANGFLVMYSIFAIIAGAMIGGITNTNIAALERRFGLDSSQSALIVVSYDIAFCILTAFVTYFGAKTNIPRLIGIGAITFGTGALVYALPHFTTPLYNHGSTDRTDLCNSSGSDCSNTRNKMEYNMYILLVGQLLMGCGAIPLYTLGIAFIEDSVSKRKAPIYIGIANACALFGPVIGFTCGGAFLTNYYVDFDSVDASSVNLQADDPRWVGAWWIGPLAMMAFCWATVIPFCGFPKQLPGTAQNRETRVSEVHTTDDLQSAEKLGANNTIGNFLPALLSLLKNPTYIFLILAGCASGGTVSGATSFLSKFIQNAFHISAGNAAILAGAVLVPGAGAGHLIGGIVISKFKWKTPAIIIYSSVCCFIVAAISPAMLLYCDNISLAGVTASYSDQSVISSGNLSSSCNADCACQLEFYKPTCGSDSITYFSPCHVGCLNERENENGEKLYSNCNCTASTPNPGVNNSASSFTAREGVCNQPCTNIKLFLPLIFLVAVFIFQSHTAGTVVVFRIVPESLRSFSVGLAWLFFRALGTIPGPIMYGKYIDDTCTLWQIRECDNSRGSCWIYDNARMAVTFMILSVVGNALAGIFYGLMWFVYKPPRDDTKEQPTSENEVNETQLRAYENPAFTEVDFAQ